MEQVQKINRFDCKFRLFFRAQIVKKLQIDRNSQKKPLITISYNPNQLFLHYLVRAYFRPYDTRHSGAPLEPQNNNMLVTLTGDTHDKKPSFTAG